MASGQLLEMYDVVILQATSCSLRKLGSGSPKLTARKYHLAAFAPLAGR